MTLAVVAIALMVAVGHAVVALVVRQTRLYWFERWALAFLSGAAAISALWMLFSPF